LSDNRRIVLLPRRLMNLQTPPNSIRMDATKYWLLIWQLLALLDAVRYQDLNIEEVKLHARGGAISVLLGEMLQGTSSFHAFTEEDWKSFNEEIAHMVATTDLAQHVPVAN